MELVQLLTSQLGITEPQATGGLGLILGLAKEKLGSQFSTIAGTLPGVDKLINAAPKPAEEGSVGGGFLGAVGEMFGGKAGSAVGQVSGLSSLASGFKKLGLDSGMIAKFLPIVTGFLESKGGASAKALLEKVFQPK